MHAARITCLDGPSAVEVTEVAAPERQGDQVLIEVHRAGVAFPDVLQTRGQYQLKPDLPFTPGAEVAGVVQEAPEGSSLTVGQRVAAFSVLGGYAEQVAVPETMVLPVPDAMDLDTAAALPMNYLTCLFALLHRGRLVEGETVLVHGASGGIGTAGIQVAKAAGARVIAVVSTAEKEPTARAAGADEVILAEGFKDAAKSLTDGHGVDVVLDPVGGDRFTDSLRSLRTEGRLLVIGFTGGSIPEVKVNRLLLNNIEVVGVGWGAYWMSRPELVGQQWSQLLDLWEKGGIEPPLGTTYPLAQAADALAELDERRAQGKVLLRVRD